MIDSRTLILVLGIGNVVLASLLLAFDRSSGLTRAGRRWTLAKFLEGLGFLCIALRGQIPETVSIGGADSALIVGFAFEFAAAARYLKLRIGRAPMIAVTTAMLVIFWIAFSAGIAETARLALFTTMLAVLLGSTGIAFVLRWRRSTLLGHILGVIYLAIALVVLVRGGHAIVDSNYLLLSRSIPQALTTGAMVVFMLANGFGFLVLAQEDATRQLVKNRERLVHARRITRMASVEMDLTTGLPLWSSGIPELLGFPPGHGPVDWTAFRALIHPDDQPKVDDSVLLSQAGKALEPDEYRVLGNDGKWRWLRREAELLPSPTGGPNTILITLQDVTERVQMETELRQGYASLKRAQRMGKIGSVDIDLATMKVTWSDELYAIYGRDPKEGPADLETFFTYLHPEDRHLIPAIREQYLSGMGGGAHEFRIVRPDGSVRWIHREAEQTHDAAGRPVGLVTVEQDVTEGVLMASELRHGRDRLVFAQRIGRIGSAEIDLATGKTSRSDEYHRLIGLDPANAPYSAEEIVAAFHPDDRETIHDGMRAATAREDIPAVDLRVIHADGSITWVKRHQEFIRDVDGSINLAIVTIQDVTEQKILEQAKDEFVSTVSHELRTPLTSIRGALALVTASVGNDVSEKVRHLLDVAMRNSERLAHLVDDLLDVQRIAAGRMIYHLADVSLAPLIEDAAEGTRPFGSKHGVEIKLGPIATSVHIHGDAERLMQVMNNLLSNAIKYSKPGQAVEISLERRSPWVRIIVEDHGEGIPASFHAKMFKPFSQSDSSDTRRRGGSGLGLSIVAAIVKYHEGRISFETEMGRGTRFYVDLKEAGNVAGEIREPTRAAG